MHFGIKGTVLETKILVSKLSMHFETKIKILTRFHFGITITWSEVKTIKILEFQILNNGFKRHLPSYPYYQHLNIVVSPIITRILQNETFEARLTHPRHYILKSTEETTTNHSKYPLIGVATDKNLLKLFSLLCR